MGSLAQLRLNSTARIKDAMIHLNFFFFNLQEQCFYVMTGMDGSINDVQA